MTEEIIKECKNCDALGIDSEIGVYYCCLSHRQDDLPKEFTCNDFTPNNQLKRLEQENKELKEANKKMYQSMHEEICEYDEELGIEKASHESDLETLDTYRSALEEIKSWARQLYYHAIKKPVKREQTIDKIQQKCNEVLK